MYKWRLPLDKGFKLGPKFGVVDSWHPNGHRGTDLNGVPGGHPIKAVGNGVVTDVRVSEGLGNTITIKVGKWYFGFAHMVKPSTLKVGDKVASGQVLGGVGTTGKFSSGNHLHYTLSLVPDGLFAGKVYDAHAFILKMSAAEAKAPKTAPPVVETVTPSASVSHCATCTCKG